MFTFKREEKTNLKTGKVFFVDHYEMRNGEKRIMPNNDVQEIVKAGQVDAAMLQDKDFREAYEAFLASFSQDMSPEVVSEENEVKTDEE